MKAYPLHTSIDDIDLENLGLGALSLASFDAIFSQGVSKTEIRGVPKYEEDSDDYCRIPNDGEWYLCNGKAFKADKLMSDNYAILRLAIVAPYTDYKEVEQL